MDVTPICAEAARKKLAAAVQPVQNPVHGVWITGGKPVHDTTYWGEQTGKHAPAPIRSRFVPALSAPLTTKAENIPKSLRRVRKELIISECWMMPADLRRSFSGKG
ncbi:hypothetical protein [Mesorhizobium sp.]|uniref:hypothetical protein n=1 Tax=Mesorhizobium sp. TaxID=1871066 RepID=UPI000FE783B1|nr:hypothetical protein [Mesorhizobium sp.]RWO53418.1 MAG: hypothetical protein EOS13_11835 [Mesorhizobium sp.]TIN22446.1 MAG: hypothetical protein E5Y19_32585 [Mesorhizobium sp.]TIN42480.1 MAG: hypothetical protein E5Y13_01350 [Mesorhizobium sp.]TJU79419.1 MAG: hypothetical protein E5Y15_24405 [Mesorhizobium sp.]TJU91251.1 MAG: hypothetical protein E5Y10_07825 [Mesorhizobium sp.]